MSLPVFLFDESLASAQSMGADVTSSARDISEANIVAIQGVWSSGTSPVGNMIVQGSIDGTTYSDIDTLAVSGNSGSNLFNVVDPGYRYIRLFYDRTSGTATLNVRISAKRV